MADIDRLRLKEALAVHLFGLQLLPHDGVAPRLRHDTGLVVVTDPYSGLWEPLIEDVPDYLTWAGMGLVVDAMQAKGWGLVCRWLGPDAVLDREKVRVCPVVFKLCSLAELGNGGSAPSWNPASYLPVEHPR